MPAAVVMTICSPNQSNLLCGIVVNELCEFQYENTNFNIFTLLFICFKHFLFECERQQADNTQTRVVSKCLQEQESKSSGKKLGEWESVGV